MKLNRRFLNLTASLLTLLLALAISCQPSSEDPAEIVAETAAPDQDEEPEGKPFAVIDTRFGKIEIELLPQVAPDTVAHFIDLAEVGFYDRTTFHRVIEGRLIQGGDPNSRDNNPYNDGQGGSGKILSAEFSDERFEAGTVAMARSPGDPHSASSQFFISLRRSPEWDGEYTVFGRVVEGLEAAQKISEAPTYDKARLEQQPAGKIYINSIVINYRADESQTGAIFSETDSGT